MLGGRQVERAEAQGARGAACAPLRIRCPICGDPKPADPVGFMYCDPCEMGHSLYAHDPTVYDSSYVAGYDARAKSPMGDALAAYRCEVVWRIAQRPVAVLDVGCGLGTFVLAAREKGHAAFGWEPMSAMRAASRLPRDWQTTPFARESGGGSPWDVVTAFDSLEHMADPLSFVRRLRARAWVVSVPIYPSERGLEKLTTWRHWKPREHLVFFRRGGIVKFFRAAGYRALFVEDGETQLGRADILTLGFERA